MNSHPKIKHSEKKSVLLMLGLSLVLTSAMLLALSLWKHSVDEMYNTQKNNLSQLSELRLKTEEIKSNLLAYLSPYACNDCTKNKVREKKDTVNKLFDEVVSDNPILGSEDSIELEKIKNGKIDLDQFVEHAFAELDKENKDKIALMFDEDWAVIITNFIKPIERISRAQALSAEKLYLSSLGWVNGIGILFLIALMSNIAGLVILFKKNNPKN